MFLSGSDNRVTHRFCVLMQSSFNFIWRYPWSQNNLLTSDITVASKGHELLLRVKLLNLAQ